MVSGGTTSVVVGAGPMTFVRIGFFPGLARDAGVEIAWSRRLHARSLIRLTYTGFRDDVHLGEQGLLLIALSSVKIMVCLIPPEATRKGTYALC